MFTKQKSFRSLLLGHAKKESVQNETIHPKRWTQRVRSECTKTKDNVDLLYQAHKNFSKGTGICIANDGILLTMLFA